MDLLSKQGDTPCVGASCMTYPHMHGDSYLLLESPYHRHHDRALSVLLCAEKILKTNHAMTRSMELPI